MSYLNFSWLIEDKLAGHKALSSEDDLLWLKKKGILSVVRMVEMSRAEITSIQITQQGLLDCYEPVADYHAPSLKQIDKILKFINSALVDGRPVGVSCYWGMGRTGTIMACYLVSQGYAANEAINEVRTKRPGSIETESQEDVIKEYAGTIRPISRRI